MRSSARRSDDDDDVIRARLRALLATTRSGGWVPPDDEDDGNGEPEERAEKEEGEPDGPERAAGAGTGPRRLDRLPAGLGRHRAPGRTARLDPGTSGTWTLWAIGLLAALAVVGWTWVGRPAVEQVPAVQSVEPVPSGAATAAIPPPALPSAPAGGTVVVSVVGQVAQPGLVTLPTGSRVADALAAAGGLLPDADPAAVNGAALLTDGQQIAVAVPGVPAPAVGAPAPAAPGGLLNLNSATVSELDALPGIGPVLAQRIVDHRATAGPFTSVDQLDDVSGIGPAVFAVLAQRVTV